MRTDYINLRPDDRQLTRRELEVLSLSACGLTTRQIAARLWLTPATVSCHLDHVRLKLKVHTTRDAVVIALGAGLIPLEVQR